MTCIGKDPRCPCQDGDACHYKDCGGTKARPVPKAEPVAKLFGSLPVYDTTPPQRKELSASEILNMMPSTIPAEYDGELMEFARAVEAKLKEQP